MTEIVCQMKTFIGCISMHPFPGPILGSITVSCMYSCNFLLKYVSFSFAHLDPDAFIHFCFGKGNDWACGSVQKQFVCLIWFLWRCFRRNICVIFYTRSPYISKSSFWSIMFFFGQESFSSHIPIFRTLKSEQWASHIHIPGTGVVEALLKGLLLAAWHLNLISYPF